VHKHEISECTQSVCVWYTYIYIDEGTRVAIANGASRNRAKIFT
jgi:hypothetical protein